MAIGNDDFYEEDLLEDLNNPTESDQIQAQEIDDEFEPSQEENNQQEDQFIQELLKSRGIEDLNKIKFETEEGEIQEISWNDLDLNEKLTLLDQTIVEPETGLDESEIQLINTIRSSQLTPQEYIEYIQKNSVDTYIQNSQNQNHKYSIDQYSDDEIYVMDLISKSQDITEEEAIQALENAKLNESLFKKQVTAIRNQYKQIEDETIQQNKLEQEEQQQAQFNEFAEKIEDSIINFKEFSGCELNMSEEDMQHLYTFITGRDNAGNSWFGKALNDPDTVVQMAWFVLNGEKMIQDITEYYNKEITNVRKISYEKGLKDAQSKSAFVHRQKPNNINQDYYDLDDEF